MRIRLGVLLWAAAFTCTSSAQVVRPQGGAVVRADTAALLLSDQDGGAIPLAVLALPHPPGDGEQGATATVLVETGGGALIEGYEGGLLRADVFVYVLGPDKETLALATRRLRLDLGSHRELLTRTGFRLLLTLAPPPGKHQVRVLVRSENGAFGLASAEAVVPDPAMPRPLLLAPLVTSPAGGWLDVVSATDETVLSRVWGWLDLPGILPVSSRPVLAGATAELTLVAVGHLDGTEPASFGVRLDSASATAREFALHAVERLVRTPAGVTAWRATLQAPDLEGGVYRLATTLGDRSSPSIAVIRTPSSAGATGVWPEIDLARLAPGLELPPTDTPAGGAARPMADREIIAGYLAALGELTRPAGGEGGRGGGDAALWRLYELETRVLGLFESDALAELERLEAETVAALLDGHWPALLPVILLHAKAVRGYRAAARSALVGHSEHMVLRFTRTWVERVGGDTTRRDAARILADIAAELRRLGTLARAEEIYRHALDIDPRNEDLVLALASIRERWGRSAAVVTTLEEREASRLSPEGGLRLAVNLGRTGRRRKAERIFRQLWQDDRADDWIRILAVQELAKSALERDGAESAAALLRRGLELWPAHPTLRLHLAYTLDRTGQPARATEIVEGVGRRASAHSVNERFRYNEWPRPAADDGRRAMTDRANRLLQDLSLALDELIEGAPR